MKRRGRAPRTEQPPDPSTWWCPRCRAEYRPGFTVCAQCRVDLVPAEPPRKGEAVHRRADRPAFRVHCPRCGTRFPADLRGEWFETSARCNECGVAVLEDPPQLAPGGDEYAYSLDGMPLIQRTAVTAELMDRLVPYRWEDGCVLVVPPTAESLVDRLLDEVGAPADDAGSAGDRP